MPKRPPAFVGLELEPSAVYAASVAVNGTLSVATAASAPLEAGIVRDGEVTDAAALSAVLRELWAANNGLPKRVRVGIANNKIVVRVLLLPPIEDAKELDAAVRFQAQDQVPMPLDTAVLDYQALDVVATPEGPRQRVVIVAARRDMIDKVLTSVRGAGLRVEGIDLAAFGMVRALSQPSQNADGGDDAVLYLGLGGTTNLAVAEGTSCTFTRVIGGGIEALAVDLAERRGLTLEHARGWLGHVGLTTLLAEIDGDELVAEEARAILADGVRRIAGDVRNQLDFYGTQVGTSQQVTRCVLTGSGSGIAGLADALADDLGLPVQLGLVAGAPEALGPQCFSVAAGLAVEAAV